MKVIYKASEFPILQNKVYKTFEEALNCSKGSINVVIDDNEFIYNSDFDSKKMHYDQEYDNSVPSNFFRSYYSRIIDYLIDKYDLDSNSDILDIGCGKGTFLKQMFSEGKYFGRALGIDPSYEGDLNPIPGNLKFIKEYFNENHLTEVENLKLIILRHTLEHIPVPSDFLKNVFSVISNYKFNNIPIFIEVPDVHWIFENKAYWDFFYEHVNYFSKKSLSETITKAGGVTTSLRNDFGNQYIWAEAIINGDKPIDSLDLKEDSAIDLSIDFNIEIVRNIKKLTDTIDSESKLVIWGMASKGIIYSIHLNKNGIKPDFFVDINENKQGKYLPIIAKKITAPSNLPSGIKLSVICMNPNYASEIYDYCKKNEIDFQLFSPDLQQINF